MSEQTIQDLKAERDRYCNIIKEMQNDIQTYLGIKTHYDQLLTQARHENAVLQAKNDDLIKLNDQFLHILQYTIERKEDAEFQAGNQER